MASRVVFSLHGIKTRGKWQKDLTPLLNQAGFTVVPLDYGYFLALQLLWKGSRAKKVDWFRDEYSRQCDRLKCERPSIIAHSLGSYLVAQALEKYPEIRVDLIIFCGAIVRRQFPWKQIANRTQVRAVLNQFGGRDIWARIVEWVVPDAGPSGLLGFEDPGGTVVQQKRADFGHSDYFYDLNYSENWIPFLKGKPLGPDPPETGPVVNWRFRITRAVAVLMLAAAIVCGYFWWRGSRARVEEGKAKQELVRPQPPPAQAPVSQQSKGENSPNITGVQGDVTIQYGQAEKAKKAEKRK
jgi:pimeloyl-ACP methyl ester carboxylesterase